MLRLMTLLITLRAFSKCSQFESTAVTSQTSTAQKLSEEDITQTTLPLKDSVFGRCTSLDNSHWARDFHECIIGENNASYAYDTNDIIDRYDLDRMLELSNYCLQTTKRCWLGSQGFIFMMENVINELKTYPNFKNMSFSMEKVKDSACIKFLSVETYRSCFDTTLEQPRLSEKNFHKKLKDALSCSRKRNKICSRTARDKLDDIVRTLLGVKLSNIEDNEDQVKTIPERTEEVIIHTTNLDDNKKQTIETNTYITGDAEDKEKQTENVDNVEHITGGTNDQVKSTTKNTENTFKTVTKSVEEAKPTTKYTDRLFKSKTKSVENKPQNVAINIQVQHARERIIERYDPPKPQPQPKRWYHYLFAPIISVWNAAKSFFGF